MDLEGIILGEIIRHRDTIILLICRICFFQKQRLELWLPGAVGRVSGGGDGHRVQVSVVQDK